MNQKIGCFGFLCILFFVAILWQAVLYVGIPIAIVGGIVAAYLFDRANSDEEEGNATRGLALLVATGSAVLFIVSAAGNIFTEDGPFAQSEAEKTAEPEKAVSKPAKDVSEIIPPAYRGRWAFEGDCEDYYSDIEVDADTIGFPQMDFSAERVIAQSGRSIKLGGTNIIGGDSWKDMGYQKDTAQLEISQDGRTLWINGSASTRCSDVDEEALIEPQAIAPSNQPANDDLDRLADEAVRQAGVAATAAQQEAEQAAADGY